MTEEYAIELQNVGKKFKVRGLRDRTLKSVVLDLVSGRWRGPSEFWALKDVDFKVVRGETLGIIGSNGAGKSTLLSLITGTFRPTAGSIHTHGKVSSLLELGAGFHPDLSGRENVFLYGAIMGLSREQVNRRFDAIVEFAGLSEWIDEPVKHYSSGMYVRLGFAVAVEVDPDILLIDEVLSVGDAVFQRKCMDKMEEFRRKGKTMLIISHDLSAVMAVSDRVLFLDEGTVHGLGVPSATVEAYQSLVRKKEVEGKKRVWGTEEVVISDVEFRDGQGAVADTFSFGDPLVVRISYKAEHRIERPIFGFAICDPAGRVIYGSNTQIAGKDIASIDGEGAIELRIERLILARGRYVVSFSIHSWDHKINYYRLENAFPIGISCNEDFEGCHMSCTWSG
jgi:ABC-type polysaccharide/polyol phosphate transport system ATPase subunit